MRWFLNYCPLLALAICLATGGAVCQADGFPYRARVVSQLAEVRGGPDDTYAATLTLPQGSEVEVYRHDPGGWCAIRPPEGSFSLVFARHVDLLDGGLGRINKEDVPSRVGSSLTELSDVVQIRLESGELVEILGELNNEGDVWQKIAPPAGEFRWIRAADLQLVDPVVGQESEANSNQIVQTSDSETDWAASPIDAKAETNQKPNTGLISKTAGTVTPATAPQTTTPPANLSQDIAITLEALEIHLSQMVAQDRSNWQIEPLEKETEALLTRATTIDEREAVKQTLAKIDRFAAIQRRFAMAGTQPPTRGASPVGYAPRPGMPITPIPPGNLGNVPPGMPPGAAAPAPPYDAVGVLRPVVSRRAGAPQFALVNDRGEILSFLTPTPDLNLQPYLGQKIAVLGTRQYLPEFQRAHVTAGRVMPLSADQRTFLR